MANSWFNYAGGDVCNPTSYTSITTPNCLSPKQQLCAIFAQAQIVGGVVRPIISPELCSEIHNAVATLTESPNVKLKP